MTKGKKFNNFPGKGSAMIIDCCLFKGKENLNYEMTINQASMKWEKPT